MFNFSERLINRFYEWKWWDICSVIKFKQQIPAKKKGNNQNLDLVSVFFFWVSGNKNSVQFLPTSAYSEQAM